MYASMYHGLERSHSWLEGSNKVDTVCEELMRKLDESEGLLPIISCLVKSSKSDVSTALTKIEEIRGKRPRVPTTIIL